MPKFKNIRSSNLSMKRGFILGSLVIAFLLFVPLMHAAPYTYVISNSAKWTDVYSSVLFSNLQGLPNSFLTSTSDGPILAKEIEPQNNVRVLTSSSDPYVFNYASQLKSSGFSDASEEKSSDFNLDLINELPNITNFIVVGDSFGYNALAVAPYAIQTNAWVFLANANNIYKIDSLLSNRNINSLMIYGYVDPSVRDVLSKYNPEVINNGDRFTDNVEIVKKYLAIHPMEQVVLTNGEFIEKEVMAGSEPVLFTGQQNVPSQISNWLKTSNIKVGVLIGNDLVGAATNIRRDTGISVMVKFARNARDQTGGVAPVEGLDLFPVPTPHMELQLHGVDYNKANSMLDVTYRSNSNIPIYIKGTVSVKTSDGITKTGDLDPIFVSPGEYKTIGYPLNITPSTNMTAEIYTLYGETPDGLELSLTNTTNISIIEVIDKCPLTNDSIKSVVYNKQDKSIFVKVKNTNKADCWASSQIYDMKIGYSTQTLGTQGAIIIPAGKTRNLEIKQELSDSDIQKNPYVNLAVFSGEKEDSLVNTLKGTYPLGVQMFSALTYSIAAIILILIALVILFIILKKKQKDYY